MGLDYNVKEIRLYDGTTIPVVAMDDEWGRDFDFPDDAVRVLPIPADGTVLNFLLKFDDESNYYIYSINAQGNLHLRFDSYHPNGTQFDSGEFSTFGYTFWREHCPYAYHKVVLGHYNGEYYFLFRQGLLNYTGYPELHPYYTTLFKLSGEIPEKNIIPGYPGKPGDTGGGNGKFDDSSDDISLPEDNDMDAINANFVSMYKMTKSELSDFASKLWSTDIWDNLLKKINNPMEYIISLHTLPVSVPQASSSGISIVGIPTGATGGKVTKSYVDVDCGTLTIDEYWGNALDYSYTRLSIYLPYVGIVPLNGNLMGATINVVYRVEVLTGAFICFIHSLKNGKKQILSYYSGTCSSTIPFNSNDFSKYLQSVISAGVVLAQPEKLTIPTAIETADNVLNASNSIQSGGSYSGNVGSMGVRYPYLIITRPVWQIPGNYYKYHGFPSYITKKLSDVTGFTKIARIKFEHITATDEEKTQIMNLLTSGVYF